MSGEVMERASVERQFGKVAGRCPGAGPFGPVGVQSCGLGVKHFSLWSGWPRRAVRWKRRRSSLFVQLGGTESLRYFSLKRSDGG